MSNTLSRSQEIATPFALALAATLNEKGFATEAKHSPTYLSVVVDPTPNDHGFVTNTAALDVQAWKDTFLTVEVKRYGSFPLTAKTTIKIDENADANLARFVLAQVQA